jgi:hypothetical protein
MTDEIDTEIDAEAEAEGLARARYESGLPLLSTLGRSRPRPGQSPPRGLRRRFAPLGWVWQDLTMTTLVDDLVPDQLWALVEPLLPAPPRPRYGGRHRTIPDRNCFAAIVFMARSSTPWRLLPARELGCGSPTTCWRRLTNGPRPASSMPFT